MYNAPHRTAHGHTFQIDDHGLAVKLTFADGTTKELSGEEAKAVREWLNSCELRSQAEHDAIQAERAANSVLAI